jgi:hypothetical protein
MIRILFFAIVCLVGLSVLGCGSSPSTGPVVPAGASEAIAETQSLILETTYGGAPLKSVKDLDQYIGRFPKAVAALKNNEVKMIWGKQILDNAKSPQVIAYESKAESGEGWAVKEDGKIHKVSSADLPQKK